MFNKVLVLSPHTDDAELGAGGTIIKFMAEKKEILWVVFSTAEESLPKEMDKDTLEKEFISVTKKLNLHKDQYIVNHFQVRKLHEKLIAYIFACYFYITISSDDINTSIIKIVL